MSTPNARLLQMVLKVTSVTKQKLSPDPVNGTGDID